MYTSTSLSLSPFFNLSVNFNIVGLFLFRLCAVHNTYFNPGLLFLILKHISIPSTLSIVFSYFTVCPIVKSNIP